MATTTNSPWRTKATSGGGGEGDFELPPVGTHGAVCVGLIDLGTHEREFQGEITENRKLLLVWELTAEFDADGNNFIVHRDYTWSLNQKASLRKLLEGWTGKTLPDGVEFDIAEIVGKTCQITLVAGVSKAGKKYVNVNAVASPMKGASIPPATHEPFVFFLGDIHSSQDEPTFPSWIPPLYGKSLLEVVKASKEWQSLAPF